MAISMIHRRTALGFGVAVAALPACGSLTPEPAPALATPAERLRAFVMMRGALDERLVIGYLSGRYQGVVDEELTPLYGVLAATFARYRRLPDGSYLVASFEHAYYTDLESGAVLSQWRNPYNGRTVSVPVWSSQPAQRIITPDLHFSPTKPMAGVRYDHSVLPLQRLGDDVVFVERVSFKADAPPPARPFRYNEMVTLRARAGALADRHAQSVPCSTGFDAIVSWRPWLQMGEQPGHLMAQGAGQYGVGIDALPATWLEATRRLRPDLVADPARLLNAAWPA